VHVNEIQRLMTSNACKESTELDLRCDDAAIAGTAMLCLTSYWPGNVACGVGLATSYTGLRRGC